MIEIGSVGAIRYFNCRIDGRHVCSRANDLPAILFLDGTKFWYTDGFRHRDDNKPAIEWASGLKEYFRRGI